MKSRIGLSLVIVLVGAASFAVGMSLFMMPHWSQPKLDVPRQVDLGIVSPNQTLDRAIPVSNRGWRSLVLLKIETSCGCTVPLTHPEAVEPGATVYVVVRVHMPNNYAPFHSSITLLTNDPDNKARVIELSGTPDKRLTISPTVIALGYITPGYTKESAIHVASKLGFDRMSVVSSDAATLAVGLRRDADGGRWVDLAISGQAHRGRFQEYAILLTGILDQPVVTIPITGVVERGIRVRPEQFYFDGAARNGNESREVELQILSDKWTSFNIKQPDNPPMRVTLSPSSDNARRRLIVHLERQEATRSFRSSIRLSNNSGDYIDIPVYVQGRP